MILVRRFDIICCACLLAAHTLASDLISYPGSKKLVFIMNKQGAPTPESENRNNVARAWTISFLNESDLEIAEIDMQYVSVQRDTRKDVFKGPVTTLRNFTNAAVVIAGSLLPRQASGPSEAMRVDQPGNTWRTDTYDDFRVIAVRVYKPGMNLHNDGHLFSKMQTTPPAEMLKIFQKDPSLCKLTNEKNFTTTLMAFSTTGPEVIDFILKHGGSLNDKTKGGNGVLDFAPLNKYPGALDIAVKKVGNINHVNPKGRTPLMKAVAFQNIAGVKYILKYKPNVDAEDPNGITAAMTAINMGHPGILDLLYKAGANPLHLNKGGWGWMSQASIFPQMVPHVLKYGVPVDQLNPKTKMTPLILCVSIGQIQCVSTLVGYGANPNAKDAKGKTARDYSFATNTLNTDRFYLQEVAKGMEMRKTLAKGKKK